MLLSGGSAVVSRVGVSEGSFSRPQLIFFLEADGANCPVCLAGLLWILIK